MDIRIPSFSMVIMVGPSCSGKSTFAHQHFSPTEIISSDACRAMVSDDPFEQTASTQAFEVLHHIARTRLHNRLLTVIDATNLQSKHRDTLVAIAREYDCPPIAIVMSTPLDQCLERSRQRDNQRVPEKVIRNHHRQARKAPRSLRKEGIRRSYILDTQDTVDQAVVTRSPSRHDHRHNHGPFDIIGDIHGCYDDGSFNYSTSWVTNTKTGSPPTPPAAKQSSWETWSTAGPPPTRSLSWLST